MSGRKGTPRFSAAEMQRQSWDQRVSAELEAARLREENRFLRERVDQLDAREERLMLLLKQTAARIP